MLRQLRIIFLGILLSEGALAQSAALWPDAAQELYSPGDPEGFLPPAPVSGADDDDGPGGEAGTTVLEEADEAPSPLEIWSSTGSGFLHQGRRKARALDDKPQPLPARSRVYTGAQGVLALGAEKRFFAVLLPKTSLHSAEGEKGWRWTLLDGEANLRLSCLGEAPVIRWKNPNEPLWELVRLRPDRHADFILVQDADSLSIWQLEGTSTLWVPTGHLLPGRAPSQLRELQDAQLSALKSGKSRIVLYPGQVLKLRKKAALFSLVIGLPQSKFWAERYLLSSPELEKKGADPEVLSLESWRRKIADEKLKEFVRAEASVFELLRQQRWEAALTLLRQLPEPELNRMGSRRFALEALLLYRLGLTAAARELKARISDTDPWRLRLEAEDRQALLRDQNFEPSELTRPALVFEAEPLPSLERYSLALNWQQRGQLRYALDAWKLPTGDVPEPLVELSQKEWIDALLDAKPWFFHWDTRFGYESNVTASPADEETLSLFDRRDSFLGELQGRIDRYLDHTAQHHFALRLEGHGVFYGMPALQKSGLLDLRFGLALGSEGQLWPELGIELQPFVGRRQRGGSAAVDLYGLETRTRYEASTGQWQLGLAYSLGLDPDPSGASPFDVETGERSLDGDQGLAKMDLDLRWQTRQLGRWRYVYGLRWQELDYRAAARKTSDRQIVGLLWNPVYAWSPAWASKLLLDWRAHLLAGGQQQAVNLRLRTEFRSHLRWTQGLSFGWEQQASVLYGKPQSSSGIELSSSFRW